MATSIWTRARLRLGARVTRNAVVDLVALARDLGAALAEVAGLFADGAETAGNPPSGSVPAPARVAPAPRAPAPKITSRIDLGTLRLERRVRDRGCSRLVRRLPANGVRCHAPRQPGGSRVIREERAK